MEAIKKQATKLREQVAKQQQHTYIHLYSRTTYVTKREDRFSPSDKKGNLHNWEGHNMEAIKKQATKLREQVANQQQAILRQLGHLGHESVMVDEAELEIHQRLQELYMSTRAAKHFQRDIVRGVEGYISTSKKQVEIARKLVDNCYKYGGENQNGPSTLPKVAMEFGTSHAAMEDQREIMLGVLGEQVCEPLRASIHGAPLEDARHLTHRYDRMRQEFESQATEVIRRQSKFREASTESLAKLKNAETRLSELKSSVLVLGKEATDAMLSVEEEQQQITFQKLLTMVDTERSYHQNVLSILEKLHSEMLVQEQLGESSPQSSNSPRVLHDTTSNGTEHPEAEDKSPTYFIAKVMHSFDAQADGELSLEVGDYVVVRQVAPNGWSEGECNGKSGWFPSAYVVKSDKVPAIKMAEKDTTP